MKQVIEEAQEMAVQQHHVEYKSNLWIGQFLLFLLRAMQ